MSEAPGSVPPPGATTAHGGSRCPRCGGVAEPPPHRPSSNPFLSKKRPRHVVCVDCGLDFDRDDEPKADDPPW